MIKIINTRYFLKSYLVLNSQKLRLLDAFRITTYNNFLGNKNLINTLKSIFFIKKISHSIQIDLTLEEEQIFKNFKSNTRNEIKKVLNEECRFFTEIPIVEFVEFYNEFAQKKNLQLINETSCSKYGDNIRITAVEFEGNILTMHAYYVDESERMAVLLYSASKRLDDDCDNSLLKLIGYSNRFLHYSDMQYFKRVGLCTYDFGGIYIGEEDLSQIGIANFKKGFGGKIVERINYSSLLYNMILKYFHS